MIARIIVTCVATIFATTAWAGDVEDWPVYEWGTDSKIGTLTYETDSGNMAVYRSSDGEERFYIRGLAGVGYPSGVYEGFFVSYVGGDPCPSGPGKDHLGAQLPVWGHVQMNWFKDEGGEVVWSMHVGRCNEPISADPMIASYIAH